MVCLLPEDVATKEVLGWKGLHLFHHPMSSASQKLRIFLRLKGLDWVGHPVDIIANAHLTPHFLGINPRGLLPVLIDDGAVHIESNDIMRHLERRFPEPRLFPVGEEDQAAALLERENEAHLDLRILSFRFVFAPDKPPKSEEDLRRYASGGTGTVRGARDRDSAREIAFWRGYLENDGITDEAVRRSARVFRDAFGDLDHRLADGDYILGDALSAVDIAWLIYAQRLTDAGYPLRALHPRVEAWRARLMARPRFADEVALPDALRERVAARQRLLRAEGRSLADIGFPDVRPSDV